MSTGSIHPPRGRGLVAASSISGAIAAAATPVTAFVILSPAEYGTFSLPYLFMALGLSLQFSVVTDAWTRTRTRHSFSSPASDVFGALLFLALAFSLLSGVALALIAVTHAIWGAALAIGVTMLRNGVRYWNVAAREHLRVLIADVGGIGGFVAFILIGLPVFDPLVTMILAWGGSAVAGLVGLRIRPRFEPGLLSRWVRVHRESMRALVADSALLDLGGIGTPLVLAPMLGIGPFGVYRGISNVALPVRLILDPMRPVVGSPRSGRLTQPALIAAATAFALLLGAACYLILAAAVPALGADLGTLSALEGFALPSALFVTVSFVGHLYYIVCRSRLDPRRLIVGRMVQTFAAIAFPLIGALFDSLEGAVWGFVAASSVTAVIYVSFGASLGGRTPAPTPQPSGDEVPL